MPTTAPPTISAGSRPRPDKPARPAAPATPPRDPTNRSDQRAALEYQIPERPEGTPTTSTTWGTGPTPPPYDPNDPSTWPGATWSAYNPAPGTDPEWDAYMATFTAQVAQRNAEARAARQRLATEYEAGIASIDARTPGQRRELEAGLLAKGIGRSGEAMRRAASLEAAVYQQKADADRARLEGYNAIETGLTGSLTDLAADREAQIAASRLRLLDDNREVPETTTPGAGTSSGYKPPKKKQTPKKSTTPPPAAPPPTDYNSWIIAR